MRKIIPFVVLFFWLAQANAQKFVCQMDFAGPAQETEVFEFDSRRIERKQIEHGNYTVEVKITKDEEEWSLALTVFDFSKQKESLYEARTQYGVDSDETPFHIFTEIFVRDTINLLCDCQKI